MYNVLRNEHIDVYVCPQLIHEIRDVANRPKIRSRIKDEDIDQLFGLIKTYCINKTILQQAVVAVRDPKDLYLLSLCETLDANYVISGDKDLLELQTHKKTRIVSPAQFKMIV
jgi:putative PIN family toxin of toxin-antitoxin system